MAAPPITHEYEVRCDPERAFAVYTGRIGEWWDPRYTANPKTLESVTIEPHVLRDAHGSRRTRLGEVTAWEPGRRLVHTFSLAQDPAHPSEVDVELVPRERGGCVVRFARGGWTDANVGVREKFGDWSVVLERFAALAESDG